MKYSIQYGTKVGVFPAAALEVIGRASAADLRVLLCLCTAGESIDLKKLIKATGCHEAEVKESLSFWRGAGLLTLSEDAALPAVPEKILEGPAEQPAAMNPKKKKSADELPKYTSEELADLLESRNETATLIDECQNIMGKVFNIREINVLLGMLDYLGLDCEYIMMLLTYCVSIGKKTLHYAETTAFALYDNGITTASELEAELRRREAASAVEGRVRNLFGIGERAFTSKEKKFMAVWVGDMNYSFEIIEKAYEVTADATGKGSFAYANAVLERWNAAGLRTLEAIEESYKNSEGKPQEGSFETDSFFAAAVSRSLGDKESK